MNTLQNQLAKAGLISAEALSKDEEQRRKERRRQETTPERLAKSKYIGDTKSKESGS